MAKAKANVKAKANAKTRAKPASGDAAVRAKIAELPAKHRKVCARLHEVITEAAPALEPLLYYGMPWYAKDGVKICFFRADKLISFGLTEEATLGREAGAAHQLLPSAWYLTALDAATEARVAEIVRSAAG